MPRVREITRIDNLTDLSKIAEHYGVTRQAVHKWTTYKDFPHSVADLNGGRVWLMDQVRDWHVARATRQVIRLARKGVRITNNEEDHQ